MKKEARFRGACLPKFLRDVEVDVVRLTELESLAGMHISRRALKSRLVDDTIVVGSQLEAFERLMTLLHEYFHAAYPDLSEQEITEEEIKVYNMVGVPVSDERGEAYQRLLNGWKGGWE